MWRLPRAGPELQECAPWRGGFISNWIDLLDDAREEVVHTHGDSREALRAMEFAAVKVSLANLRTFSCVREREADGRIKLHGAYLRLMMASFISLMRRRANFRPLDEPRANRNAGTGL